MRRFYLGFGTAVIVGVLILLAVFIYVRFGFLDMRADIPVNPVEKAIAAPSLDASVDRRAPKVQDPISPTDATLITGMNIYQTHCSMCHGDIDRPHAMLADSLYPRAPQFLEDAPDMPANQNFFIIQHGVRWTGMPSWKQSLGDQQMWQVTTFLSHMDKLPPQVSDLWKAAAGGSMDNMSSPHSPTRDMKDKNPL